MFSQKKDECPCYLEELSLSRFFEDFLDFQVVESFDSLKNSREDGDENSMTMHQLESVINCFEVDRMLFKAFNAICVLQLMNESLYIRRLSDKEKKAEETKELNDRVSLVFNYLGINGRHLEERNHCASQRRACSQRSP